MTRSRIESVLALIDCSSFPIPITLAPSNCGTKVSASLQAPDTRGGVPVQSGVKAGGLSWPAHTVELEADDDQAVAYAARKAVGLAVAHEIDEHFKYRGALFNDPHPGK
jgi:hypothetical protein